MLLVFASSMSRKQGSNVTGSMALCSRVMIKRPSSSIVEIGIILGYEGMAATVHDFVLLPIIQSRSC